ncbi:MAG: nucleoside hydrolase, partial [Nanoarchaeota archaeon]
MVVKTILFTDLGRDISDLVAVAYAARATDLRLVVASGPDAELKARMIDAMFGYFGSTAQVLVGSTSPYCTYHYFDPATQQEVATEDPVVETITRTIEENQGIRVVMCAPMTDLARVCDSHPHILRNKVESVYVQGSCRRYAQKASIDAHSRNLRLDREAAVKVFKLMDILPFTFVPERAVKKFPRASCSLVDRRLDAYVANVIRQEGMICKPADLMTVMTLTQPQNFAFESFTCSDYVQHHRMVKDAPDYAQNAAFALKQLF